MLSKKHFKAIAEIVKNHNSRNDLIDSLADYFATENPRFDSYRFRQACTEE